MLLLGALVVVVGVALVVAGTRVPEVRGRTGGLGTARLNRLFLTAVGVLVALGGLAGVVLAVV